MFFVLLFSASVLMMIQIRRSNFPGLYFHISTSVCSRAKHRTFNRQTPHLGTPKSVLRKRQVYFFCKYIMFRVLTNVKQKNYVSAI
jgi:hypothetical protein